MGPLVLLRHGESTANADDRFGGWLDEPLTPLGMRQAEEAGRTLRGFEPDEVHSSVLSRAVDTARLVAEAADWSYALRTDWRLNERHYGALQGVDKEQARAEHGADQVELWRRSPDVPPPPADPEVVASQEHAVSGESLADVAERMAPYWREVLLPALGGERRVLVVSHGNALRALLHLVTGAPLAETALAVIPTATPIKPSVGAPAR